MLALMAFFGQIAVAQAQTPLRINVAGGAYTDSLGQSWAADSGYNTGTASSWGNIAIAGTADAALYRKERWDASAAPEMQYSFAVANGSYQVRLHFAENMADSNWPNGGVGVRVFHVDIEGVRRFPSLDVLAEAGNGHVALIKTANVTVADGQLNILFTHVVEDPMVNAIEILPQAADTQAPTVPAALVAAAASSTQANLLWVGSTDNVGTTEYAIERCSGASCSNFAQIATTASTNYSDTGLSPSAAYRYRVRARDAAGNYSAYSGIADASTQGSATTIRVNTGGAAFTDNLGQVWSADTGFNTGSAFSWGNISILGTATRVSIKPSAGTPPRLPSCNTASPCRTVATRFSCTSRRTWQTRAGPTPAWACGYSTWTSRAPGVSPTWTFSRRPALTRH
jgi:chitodextrinase